MAEKVTTMVLTVVDLKCEKCYKKVKKVLCKFPQIQDQVYDEKKDTVTIKVVCCSPEKIRDKLCCKGGGSIKSIEIKEPEKPPPPPDKNETDKGEKDDSKKNGKKKSSEAKTPAQGYPPIYAAGVCFWQCNMGQPGCPCYQCCRRPLPPPPCYCGCGCGYGGQWTRGCYSRCDYFSEENPSGCVIM